MKSICPSCGETNSVGDNYCGRCLELLNKHDNRLVDYKLLYRYIQGKIKSNEEVTQQSDRYFDECLYNPEFLRSFILHEIKKETDSFKKGSEEIDLTNWVYFKLLLYSRIVLIEKCKKIPDDIQKSTNHE